MSNDEENFKEKDVAFYAATVNAWYTTKFERDKHLLSLASAGIGLLVTLVISIGVTTVCIAIMYILAVLSFLVCISIVLFIFNRNAEHLIKMTTEGEARDPILGICDKIASSSFVFGIIFTLLVGLSSGIENFNQKETIMANEIKKMVEDTSKHIKKSVDGAAGMRPTKPPTQPSDSSEASQSGDSNSNKK